MHEIYENLKDKENGETPVELIRSRPEYSCRATAKDYLSQQDRQSEQQQQPCAEHRTDFSHGNELLRKPTSRILRVERYKQFRKLAIFFFSFI